MTTVHDVIDEVCQYLDQLAESNGLTLDECYDKAMRGELGDRAKLAHEVWYAWQYDGIDGGSADKWVSLTVRPARTYTVSLREECGGSDSREITIPAGTEDEQDDAIESAAEEYAREWMADGEWGESGAAPECTISIKEEDGTEWHDWTIRVEIEPDHDSLIRAAGGDPDCDHDWTASVDVCGGLDCNPGVFTGDRRDMHYVTYCRCCGLIRTETQVGPNRDPGAHDTVEYRLPTEEERADMGLSDNVDE